MTRAVHLLHVVLNSRYFKPAVFLACLAPAVMLLADVYTGGLGVDPVKTLLHETGEDALGLVFFSLAITPARRLFKLNRLQLIRRMIGVWAFAYAVMHVSVYLVFDQSCYSLATCRFALIAEDILKRKFIFAGLTAWSVLLVLAVTSTNGWIRRLGRKWQTLHRLIYVGAIAGVVHYIWIQKADYFEPAKWAAILAVLFGIRLYLAYRKRQTGRPGRVRPALETS
jgi:sulfoxide reductase heme-binding subunit YedZ